MQRRKLKEDRGMIDNHIERKTILEKEVRGIKMRRKGTKNGEGIIWIRRYRNTKWRSWSMRNSSRTHWGRSLFAISLHVKLTALSSNHCTAITPGRCLDQKSAEELMFSKEKCEFEWNECLYLRCRTVKNSFFAMRFNCRQRRIVRREEKRPVRENCSHSSSRYTREKWARIENSLDFGLRAFFV